MELNVINEQGQETAKVAASDAVFGREYNEALIHQIVVAYMANARQGTRAVLKCIIPPRSRSSRRAPAALALV